MATANESDEGVNLQQLITTAKSEADLIGVGAVVLKDGTLIEAAAVGEKQFETGLKIDLDERWHIGSITKSMTATMLARLVEQGVLDWDDSVEDILGSKKIHKQWRGVTLRQLLTHTSGAKPNFPILSLFFRPETQEEIFAAREKAVRKTLRKKPKTQPGDYAYSNVGFTIAAHLAEAKTGKSWEYLMRSEVFAPLNLSSAGFGAPQPIANENVAWGHSGQKPEDPTGWADNTPIVGPAGTVHMTLQDLASFGQVHMDGLAGKSTYLSQQTFQILHSPILEDYAMGWVEPQKSPLPDTKVFWHNGSNTMWYALLMVVPQENIVYAMATNSGNIISADKAFAKTIKTHFDSITEMEE